MALAATSSTVTFTSKRAAVQTTTVSGGTQPYSISVAPNAAVATASIVGATGVVTITPVGPGTTTLTVLDSAAATKVITVTIAATVVKVNTRISSAILGTIQADNATYWDPVTATNLTRGNPTSGTLDGFTDPQLQNISQAVQSGRLSLVSGALPAPTATYALYNNFFEAGEAGGDSATGITGVAAADALEPKNLSF